MKELIQEIEQVVSGELQRANGKFPLFNSTHEGLAVIEEEIWEAAKELKELDRANDNFKQCVYMNFFGSKERVYKECTQDETAHNDLRQLRDRAIKAAGELIQVAAMCDKFKMNLNDTKDEFDWEGFKAGKFFVAFKNIRAYKKFLHECSINGFEMGHEENARRVAFWYSVK